MSDAYFPPSTEAVPTSQRILIDPVVPQIGTYPNSKQTIWTCPSGGQSDRSMRITRMRFHNTNATETHSVAWGQRYLPFGIGNAYSPGATVLGTDDPGVQLGAIDLEPLEIAVFEEAIVLYPGETLFGYQAKKGTTVSGRAIVLNLVGVWEPLG